MSEPHIVSSLDVNLSLLNASDTEALYQDTDNDISVVLDIGTFEDAGNPATISGTLEFSDLGAEVSGR